MEATEISTLEETNTTIERPESGDVQCRAIYEQTGGLSGAPLRTRGTQPARQRVKLPPVESELTRPPIKSCGFRVGE